MINSDSIVVVVAVGASLTVFTLVDKFTLGYLSKAVHKLNS